MGCGAERDPESKPAWLGAARVAFDQAVGLASAEDLAHDPGNVALVGDAAGRIAPAAAAGRIERWHEELVVLDRGLRRERVDHASGEHLGERVSAAEVRRQLVEEARRISCEGAAASARMERA